MPRYFLHVFNSTGTARDDEGADLPDMAAARQLALDSIRSIMAMEARAGRIDLNGRIEIADSSGAVLDRVAYREAFVLSLGGASA
jgi:hypothetical protein